VRQIPTTKSGSRPAVSGTPTGDVRSSDEGKRLMQAPRGCCPHCGAPVSRKQRVKLEFLGGKIPCSHCGAVLHLDHRWWSLAVTVIGCEGWLLMTLGAIAVTLKLQWWIVPLLGLGLVIGGLIVGLTSPLTVVRPPR
jgi:hypothetical protein